MSFKLPKDFDFKYYWLNLMIMFYVFWAGFELAKHRYLNMGVFIGGAIVFIVLSELTARMKV